MASLRNKTSAGRQRINAVAGSVTGGAWRYAWRHALLLLALVILLAGSVARLGVAEAQEAPSEYKVKAAFLYNFAKFVEWPSGAFSGSDSPFVIAVLGDDPFGSELDTYSGKKLDERAIIVKRFKKLDDFQPCHILFVSRSEKDKLPKVMDRLGKANTLTVADMEQFPKRGGMINFFIENKKVRFEINPDAADRAGLKISSKLLDLAKVVKP